MELKNQEILDGSNYAIWKWQIESILKSKGLYEVTKTGQPAKGEEARLEEKKNQAQALIASTLDSTNKMKVLNCRNANEIWTRLQSIYENKTSFEKQNLLGKLHTYKIKSTREVSASVAEINNLAAKLTSLGQPITDEMLMSIIINALPQNYETFIGTWSLMNEKDRSLNNLLSHVEAIAEKAQDTVNHAFVSLQQNPHGNNQITNRGLITSQSIKCAYCKNFGHHIKKCHKRINKQQRDSRGRNSNQLDKDNVAFLMQEVSSKHRQECEKESPTCSNHKTTKSSDSAILKELLEFLAWKFSRSQ